MTIAEAPKPTHAYCLGCGEKRPIAEGWQAVEPGYVVVKCGEVFRDATLTRKEATRIRETRPKRYRGDRAPMQERLW